MDSLSGLCGGSAELISVLAYESGSELVNKISIYLFAAYHAYFTTFRAVSCTILAPTLLCCMQEMTIYVSA